LDAAGISIPYGGVAVDLCSGTGFVARCLLGANKLQSIIGLDLSSAQVRMLKQAAEENELTRTRLPVVQADLMKLPMAGKSTDLVIGNSFLHHLPDVGAALKEIRRVLKPGGQFVVLHEPSETSTFYESFPWSLVKNTSVENYTDLWQFQPEALSRLLEEAGFTRVRILKTGILGSLLLGTFSILVNKFCHKWHAGQSTLEYIRGSLSALEYRFSWSNAPSLMVHATVES
jgi:ubiquinone/menaquinone biosynthesis C-methylase UbiE